MNRNLSFGRDLAILPAFPTPPVPPALPARTESTIVRIFHPMSELKALLGSLFRLLIVGSKAPSQLALGQKMNFARRGQSMEQQYS